MHENILSHRDICCELIQAFDQDSVVLVHKSLLTLLISWWLLYPSSLHNALPEFPRQHFTQIPPTMLYLSSWSQCSIQVPAYNAVSKFPSYNLTLNLLSTILYSNSTHNTQFVFPSPTALSKSPFHNALSVFNTTMLNLTFFPAMLSPRSPPYFSIWVLHNALFEFFLTMLHLSSFVKCVDWALCLFWTSV